MPTEHSTQEVPPHDEKNQADEPQGESKGEQVAGDAADDKPEMPREDLLAALAKSRRQAAKYRVERNELRPLADKARELEEAGKSELQKAQERIAALEAEKQAGELEAERLQIAAKHGLPAELVTGADAEAMESMASALAAYVGEKLEEKSKPRFPVVKAVGRESGGIDPDARVEKGDVIDLVARHKTPAQPPFRLVKRGCKNRAPEMIRTSDRWYRKPVLYPLSYGGSAV